MPPFTPPHTLPTPFTPKTVDKGLHVLPFDVLGICCLLGITHPLRHRGQEGVVITFVGRQLAAEGGSSEGRGQQ